jgi:arylsulfatase A-like enzyme
VHLSLYRPHPPWIAPAPYNGRYPPDAAPPFQRATSAEQEGMQHPWLAWQLDQRSSRVPGPEAKLRRQQASYYGLMNEVDDNLGRLFTHLKNVDAWHQNVDAWHQTLIIFTSDHGEQLGDHWLLGKPATSISPIARR